MFGVGVVSAQNPDTNARNWIIADLVIPASAVAIYFPGHTTLSAFDMHDLLIGSESESGGGLQFLGIVSVVPIAIVVQDRGASGESMKSFLFTPVPEPATLILLGLGARSP